MLFGLGAFLVTALLPLGDPRFSQRCALIARERLDAALLGAILLHESSVFVSHLQHELCDKGEA